MANFKLGNEMRFFCSTLVSFCSVHFPHFIAGLKIYYLYSFITGFVSLGFLGQNILGVRGFLALFLSR